MSFHSHKGTSGHTIATDIMSDSSRKQAGKPTTSDPATAGFHSIDISKAENGITVRHTPAMPAGVKEYSEKAPEAQLHVFRNASEAHSHIGQLLGLRLGSGQQQD